MEEGDVCPLYTVFSVSHIGKDLFLWLVWGIGAQFLKKLY